MIKLIQEEWRNFCDDISEEDVERGKRILSSNLLLLLDGSTPIFEDIGRQLLVYGRRIPVTEMNARINAVTPDIVKDMAKRYLYDRPISLALVGKCSGLESIDDMQSRMVW